MDEVLIFANPIAGRGTGVTIARQLEMRLRHAGYEPRVLLQRPNLIDQAELGDSPRAAIVIGGDGTLRAVADRLFLDKYKQSPSSSDADGPPLLVVPLGTANLMGRHLGIRWDEPNAVDRIVHAIEQGKVRRLDTAQANGKLFLLMVGVGFDAHIVHELDRLRNGPIRFASYLLPAALALSGYRYAPLTVNVDGRTVFQDQPGMAFVGNVPEYGTGFPMLPHARPDDGQLDVCVLPCRSRSQVLRLFLIAAAGEHLQAEGAVYLKGSHVRIESPQPIPAQVDGDIAGHTPLQIDLLPIRLPFIVPPL